jgi:hypothetical protein
VNSWGCRQTRTRLNFKNQRKWTNSSIPQNPFFESTEQPKEMIFSFDIEDKS